MALGFKECLEIGVDFMDMSSGYIFKIAEHERALKFGLPVNGIRVIEPIDGSVVGVVEESEIQKYRSEI